SASGRGFLLPQWLDALEDQAGVNRRDRQRADFWVHIFRHRVSELLCVFWMFPTCFVSRVILPRGVLERHRPCGFQSLRGLIGGALFERVDAVFQLLACSFRSVTGFLKSERVQRAKTHPAFTSVALVAQQPRSILWLEHLKIEPVAVAVAPRCRRLRYSLNRETHRCSPFFLPRPPPLADPH